uniref:Ribosomal RNA small subunit methyltransferase A n=1 Tax=Magnetococcus massalia (strain MO-1) TaxID=451514 RepID=A0A1S7LJA5_MAGMO|nr:S-adenosylmethionine-6-N',N'-adenosyl (rRNA) dimethyltransferase [Candidatus Magnetococcus massalia]
MAILAGEERMSTAIRLKRLLAEHGIAPKKRLGQNFLIDPTVAPQIVSLAGVQAGDRVVEIGPGVGSLSVPLMQVAGDLHVVERDDEVLPALRVECSGLGALHVVREDALKMNFLALAEKLGGKLKLVANLPYNISSPLMMHLLGHHEAFESMTLMFQKEVGERLTAEPSTKAYGSMTVQCRLWMDIQMGFEVPQGAFYPAPKVVSAVIHSRVREAPLVPVADEALFHQVVRASFAQRRKTLRNSLKTMSADAPFWLDEAGIDGGVRAETLEVADFVRITEVAAKSL